MNPNNWSVFSGDYQGGKIYDDYRKAVRSYTKRKKRSVYFSYATAGFIVLYITLMIAEKI